MHWGRRPKSTPTERAGGTVIGQAHWSGEVVAPPSSRPPRYAGLDAGARGLADHGRARDADALLVWYRTMGQDRRSAVELYLARRAIAADWQCTTEQAAAIIREAMAHVATRRPRAYAAVLCMRKATFLALREQASAWLRAGIMEAVWRYELATLPEPLPPASRQTDRQETSPLARVLARCPATTGSNYHQASRTADLSDRGTDGRLQTMRALDTPGRLLQRPRMPVRAAAVQADPLGQATVRLIPPSGTAVSGRE